MTTSICRSASAWPAVRLESRSSDWTAGPGPARPGWPRSYTPGKAIASHRPPARGGLRVDYVSILAQRIGLQRLPEGVAVREVVPDSSADKARIQVDNVITRVAGRPVTTPAEFYDAMAKADGPVELSVLNLEGREDRVTVDPK